MRISDWSSDVCSSDLNCAPADDRHARLHIRAADRNHRTGDRAARPDLSLVRRGKPRVRRENLCRNHCAADLSARDERPGHLSPQQIREALVSEQLTMDAPAHRTRSEEHTSELPSLLRISYAVFSL